MRPRTAAKKRIRELETELEIHRRATEELKERSDPKAVRGHQDDGADGLPVQTAYRVRGVSESGYYAWLDRPPSARAIRHAWLTDVIREIHTASRARTGTVAPEPLRDVLAERRAERRQDRARSGGTRRGQHRMTVAVRPGVATAWGRTG